LQLPSERPISRSIDRPGSLRGLQFDPRLGCQVGKSFEDSFVEWWFVRSAYRLLFRQGLLAEGEHHRIALVVDNRLVEEDTDPVGLADPRTRMLH